MFAQAAGSGARRACRAAPLDRGPAGRRRRAAGRLYAEFAVLCRPTPPPQSPQAAAGRNHRHRPRQGRADPAAVGPRQCRRCRPVHAQRRRDGAGRVQQPEHPAPGEGRRRHRAGGPAGAQQALDEGAEIILGPLFALSVGPVGQLARSRNVPVIAFSTDANVAARGVYLLSFLPESDVERIIAYALDQGKTPLPRWCRTMPMGPWWRPPSSRRSRAATAARSSRSSTIRSTRPRCRRPARTIAQASARADALFIPDGADAVPTVVQALIGDGINTKRVQLLGTGLWDDPRIFSTPALEGAWYAAPDGRLPQFLGPLSRALRPGSGAHRDARL